VKPVSIEDYRALARRRLPRLLYEYIDGGALTESAKTRNNADFADIHLRQRVLTGVEEVSLKTEVLETELSMPVILAPIGMSGMFARRGEVAAARAARDAGTIATLSTMSICDLKEVVGAAGPVWFQLYLLRDRDHMKLLLQRAWDLGCRVLAFTVDVAVPGERLREHRQGLAGGADLMDELRRGADGLMHPGWLWDVYMMGGPHGFGNVAEAYGGAGGFSGFWTWVKDALQVSLTPDDIAWVRENWPGKLVIKGILDTDDARVAVEAGADGVIVSNHGGRQLDSAQSGVVALPRIVEAIGDQAAVLMDGGLRSGEDVVKAMALGARACLIGRPWAYALAARGEAGVAHVLELYRRQITTTLVLAGCDDVRNLGTAMIA
jgi:L-lactate dehydrogenase (cytochrome)